MIGRPAASTGSEVAWRPTWLSHLRGAAGQPTDLGKGAPEQELDLGVRTAQVVGRPLGQGVVYGRVQPQQQTLALRHGST
jgi:hypothetical protein